MAAEDVLRAAIVGCGRIAGAFAEAGGRPTTHAQALYEAPAFRLVAVSDADRSRAKAFAARWSVENVCALEEVSSAGLDVVVIATPDGAHAAHLLALLGGGNPPRLVIMEKPLCVSPDQLAEIGSAVAEHGKTTVVVNHPRRFERGHGVARDLIAAVKLGPVVGAHWVYYGGWLHNGVHVVDTLRMLLGGELRPVAVRLGCADRIGDPCLDVDLRTDTWPHARVLVEGHPESAFQLFEGEIRMQEGRARFLDFGNQILVDTVQVNSIGERELKDTRAIDCMGSPTAMQSLYELATRFLLRGDDEIVLRCGIAQAAATMRALFDAQARLGS